MNKPGELNQVLDRLHLGMHSGDGSGINRTHWMSFVSFIIDNPSVDRKLLESQLISVLCVQKRTVKEYIECAIAWNVLEISSSGGLVYNRTYKDEDKTTIPNEEPELNEVERAMRGLND